MPLKKTQLITGYNSKTDITAKLLVNMEDSLQSVQRPGILMLGGLSQRVFRVTDINISLWCQYVVDGKGRENTGKHKPASFLQQFVRCNNKKNCGRALFFSAQKAEAETNRRTPRSSH